MRCSILSAVGILSTALIVFYACDINIDHGLDALPWIEGQIEFVGKPPDTTADVIVVIAPTFPPEEWTDIIRSDPLPINREVERDTVEYRVPLPYGTYDVVGVLWKPEGVDWSFETISNILGIYTKPNLFKPLAVTLSKEKPIADSINIRADYRFIRRGAYVAAKISYTGTWREDTDMLILATFPSVPEKLSEYLFATGWDLTLPTKEELYRPEKPATRILNVAPGYQKHVALYWKKKRGNPYDFKKLASYTFPDDPKVFPQQPPGTYLAKGKTLDVELVADFNKTLP